MDGQLTISRQNRDAIFAALRGIEHTLRQIVVNERDDQFRRYAAFAAA